MNKVLITGGPTNEFIDEVMKITNMSTGATSLTLVNGFISAGFEVTFIGNRTLKNHIMFNEKARFIEAETTADMLKALEREKDNDYALVIHAAAVGDYAPAFTFRAEDMAEELFEKMEKDGINKQTILETLVNPSCKINDDAKISSYEPNLTVKLSLTPKIIANLRSWFPNALLIGFKLLDKVEKSKLINIASALCRKNKMDYIIANDLSVISKGKHIAYLTDDSGYADKDFADNNEIFAFTLDLLRKRI